MSGQARLVKQTRYSLANILSFVLHFATFFHMHRVLKLNRAIQCLTIEKLYKVTRHYEMQIGLFVFYRSKL